MNRPLSIAFVSAAAVFVAGFVAIASMQEKSMPAKRAQSNMVPAGKVVYMSSEKASYKEIMPGVSQAVIWGDPQNGPSATFTKFKPGYDAGMHTHTNDVSLVVIKGAYLYRDEAGEKRVGPGEFLRVPGGHKHWSGGDKNDTTVFFSESSGKFDVVPVK